MIIDAQEKTSSREHTNAESPFRAEARPPVAVIEKRSLIRQCLAQSLEEELALPILSYPDLESWSRDPAGPLARVVVLSGPDAKESQIVRDLSGGQNAVRVVVMADNFCLDHMINVLRCGASGYIPSDTCLDVAAQTIRLVMDSDVFIMPANAAMELWQRAGEDAAQSKTNLDFTGRENDVVEGLLKGKPNKVIAFELGMSESTVKAHIRNVFRKLHVRNRTEAVSKIAELIR